MGRWVNAGKQMVINLENAREQYSVLGYPHRTILKQQCSVCRKITLVDESIKYGFCPHCGAKMEAMEKDTMTDEQAYEKMCIGCWRESQCHEDMEYCDKFLMATEEEE